MTKLRIGLIADDKPVRLTVGLPAAVHRDLAEYGRLLARDSGQAEIMAARSSHQCSRTPWREAGASRNGAGRR